MHRNRQKRDNDLHCLACRRGYSAAAPQEVELRSAQWADAETFTLLLEYRYSPADGDGYSENMTLTVQRAAGGLHFLSCAFAEG